VTVWTVSRDDDRVRLKAGDQVVPCLIGRGGFVAARDKREGDMATPLGDWPLRRVYYRPDRVALPDTALPAVALTPELGWCDDPQDENYNRPVRLPFQPSHELMWREDGLYDFVIVLGHNDAPPRPFMGSAIFLHLFESETRHTAGCVAVSKADMLALIGKADAGTILRITDGDTAGPAA